MKKFIGYIAATAVSATLLAANTFAVGNVVRGAEDAVDGVVNGVEDVVDGAGDAVEDVVGGTDNDAPDNDITDNAEATNQANTNGAQVTTSVQSEVPGTNPNTGATLGFIGLGIGSAIAAGAAAASRKCK